MHELKIYRGVMRNDTEQGITEELCVMTQMQNFWKNNSWLEN